MSREYSVIAVEQTSLTTMVFTLRSIDPDYLLAYQPGQYATLSFMLHGRPTPARCFSISSSPTEQDILQFGMRVKGAYTTTAAKHIKVGDKVHIAGPYGRFIYNRERDKTAIFLAGGIGITPFMSMIRYATRLQLENNILLVYSVQNQHDIPFKEELLYIQTINPHFRVVFVVSDGDLSAMGGTSVMSGRMTPELLNSALGGVYDNMSFFVCGPPMFMKTMLTSLRMHAVPEGRILTEAFSQAAQKHSAWISWPSHMYALTALGLFVGTAATLAHDITAVNQPKLATTGTTYAGSQSTTSSSRGNQIDQQLSGTDGQTTETDGATTTGTGTDGTTTGTTTTGGSTTGTGSTGSGGSTGTGSTGGSSGSGSSGGSGGNTSTPTAPALTFSANTTTINTGGSATLSWNITGGTTPITCTASNGWSGTKGSTGTLTVSPTATTTYVLACKNSVNTTTKSVTVAVTAAPIAPTLNFSATNTTITAGGSTTLNWSVPSGTSPITCTASGGWSGGQSTSGSLAVSPTATTTYTLTCANSVSSVPKSVTITVNAAAVVPTVNLSASSTTITAGGSTTLSWSTTGTTPISCSGSGWSPSGASGSLSVSPGSTTTYSITCSNSAGNSQTKSVTITVNPASSGS